jgi:hypothetical protein
VTAGFAKRDITPDFSVPMAGYYVPDRFSRGIHDRLYARALVFSGMSPLVLLQLDLLNLDRLCMERLSQGMEAFGLDRSRLLVCAVHTHSGYGGFFDPAQGINRELEPLLGKADPALADLVVNQSLAAIEEALKEGVETMVRINRGDITALGTNRHDPALPCDTGLFMVELYRMDRKKALLYNLSCHPTVMNGENRLLSADFAGSAAARLENSPGGYDLVLFINGSAGDMSTRFTRRESSFAECERFGDLVAGAVKALRGGVFFPLEKADIRYYSLALQRRELPGLNEAEEELEASRQRLQALKLTGSDPGTLRKAESFLEGAQMRLLAAKYQKDSPDRETAVETGILRINDRTVVCVPLELFSTLALVLKKEKGVEIFGYANELKGYLADREAYANRDYEALSSEFECGEGERYVELVSALL